MNWLACAIFISTVLFLIDKNQQWRAFWKICGFVAVICIGVGIFLYWEDQKTVSATTQRIQRLSQINAAQQRECTTGDVFDKITCEKAIEARFSSTSPASETPVKSVSNPR